MSSTPSEILDLATRLLESPGEDKAIGEVDLRCSTSRAYYAALHAADLALPPDIAPTMAERKGKSSHQAIIDSFTLWARTQRPGRMDAIDVARFLPRLRSARKHADYKLDEDFTPSHAKEALRFARETLLSASRAAAKAEDKQA